MVARLLSLKVEDEAALALALSREGESIGNLCNWISKTNLLEEDKAAAFIEELYSNVMGLRLAFSEQDKDVFAKNITTHFAKVLMDNNL